MDWLHRYLGGAAADPKVLEGLFLGSRSSRPQTPFADVFLVEEKLPRGDNAGSPEVSHQAGGSSLATTGRRPTSWISIRSTAGRSSSA